MEVRAELGGEQSTNTNNTINQEELQSESQKLKNNGNIKPFDSSNVSNTTILLHLKMLLKQVYGQKKL